MKSLSVTTLGLLALSAVTPAFGEQRLTANIPFEFRVGTSVMPAGNYDVNRTFSDRKNVLRLWCHECRIHIFALTTGLGGGPYTRAKGELVFHKQGEVYFLSEVWEPNSPVGSALGRSKLEREMARDASLARTALSIQLARTSEIALQ